MAITLGQHVSRLDPRKRPVRYPNVWTDLASQNSPTTIKELFSNVEYHVVHNPVIAPAVRKLASYAITKFSVEEDEREGFDHRSRRWDELMYSHVKLHTKLVEIFMDTESYGNAFASVHFPFRKVLRCSSCGHHHEIKHHETCWSWSNGFTLKCPECGHKGKAQAVDVPLRMASKIRITRWHPRQIDLDYCGATDDVRYVYALTNQEKQDITRNKWHQVHMPNAFLEATATTGRVELLSQNVYHFKKPGPSLSSAKGWGVSPIMAALKPAFLVQVLQKAQEMVAMDRMVPLEFFSPGQGSASADPYKVVNLGKWASEVEQHVARWRQDPLHKPVMPIPLQIQRAGGDGRALLLNPEIRQAVELVLAAMMVPQEFVFGGLSWTGSSVSMRMLENGFTTTREDAHRFVQDFFIPLVCRFMKWEQVKVKAKEFKMADDMPHKQLLIQLSQASKLSDQTLYHEFGLDLGTERKGLESDARFRQDQERDQMHHQASVGREAELVARVAEEQPASAPTEERARGNYNVLDLAHHHAAKLANMPEGERAKTLMGMQQQAPNLFELISSLLPQYLGEA